MKIFSAIDRVSRISLFLVAAFGGSLSAQQVPEVFALNPHRLVQVREAYRSGDKELMPVIKKVLRDADKAMKLKPVSVVLKDQIPPSGDKHDYVSLAPYWWPDPATKDGLPYLRRDGEVNPERDNFPDRDNFGKLQSAVFSLGLAYFISGKEEYARHADELVTVWFLDSTTRMNPNLNFAQAIRGRNDGRGAGVIEMHMFVRVMDALQLIKGSAAWSPEHQSGMVGWCNAYYAWLTSSKQGLDEHGAPNNHGSWYAVQTATIAAFTGKKEEAVRILNESKVRRITAQIEPDGRQPKELQRTKAEGYSTFNLQALTTLAVIGSNLGVDLWHFSTVDGRSIKKALEWMVPFYSGEKRWPYQQIIDLDKTEAFEVLVRASSYLGNEYEKALLAMAPKEKEKQRAILLY
jgi:hypothetical protein